MKTNVPLATIALFITLLVAISSSWVASQGNLSPSQGNGALDPGGNPQPSMKTLQQVEPRIPIDSPDYAITTPGSYYLTQDIVADTQLRGILIQSSDVTLDLNGFSVRTTNTNAQSAIAVSGTWSNVTVRNGSISGSWTSGVTTNSGSNIVISDLVIKDCRLVGIYAGVGGNVAQLVVRRCQVIGADDQTQLTGDGIEVRGVNCVIEDCSVANSAGNGFVFAGADRRLYRVQGCTATNCVEGGFLLKFTSNASIHFSDCTAEDCGDAGFRSSQARNSTARSCVASRNGEEGFVFATATLIDCFADSNGGAANTHSGIVVGASSTVSRCTSTSNTARGIFAAEYCRISDCSAVDNGFFGIEVGAGSTVFRSVVASNEQGITAGKGCTISQCSATKNAREGIRVGGNGTVVGCSSYANDDEGIEVGSFSTVRGCSSSFNNGDGILAGEGTLITDCTSSNNGQSNPDNGDTITADADGYAVGGGCQVRDCVGQNNRQYGVDGASAQTIVGCTLWSNDAGGIFLDFTSGSDVRDNNLRSSGGFGGINISGGAIAPIQAGSTATHPGYNVQ